MRMSASSRKRSLTSLGSGCVCIGSPLSMVSEQMPVRRTSGLVLRIFKSSAESGLPNSAKVVRLFALKKIRWRLLLAPSTSTRVARRETSIPSRSRVFVLKRGNAIVKNKESRVISLGDGSCIWSILRISASSSSTKSRDVIGMPTHSTTSPRTSERTFVSLVWTHKARLPSWI